MACTFAGLAHLSNGKQLNSRHQNQPTFVAMLAAAEGGPHLLVM